MEAVPLLVSELKSSNIWSLRLSQILSVPHRRLVCCSRLYEVTDVNKPQKQASHQREVFLFNDLIVVRYTRMCMYRHHVWMQRDDKKHTFCLCDGRSWSCVLRRRVQPHIHSAKPWAYWACSSTCLRMSVRTHEHTHTHTCSVSLCDVHVVFFCSDYPHGITILSPFSSEKKQVVSFCSQSAEELLKFVEDLRESIAEVAEMEQIRIECEPMCSIFYSFKPFSFQHL